MNKIINLVIILILQINLFAQTDSITIKKEFNATYFNYVSPGYKLFNFNVLRPGIPVVPIKNGILVAGSTNWLKKPHGDFVQSITPSVSSYSLYAIRGIKDSTYIQHFIFNNNAESNRIITKLPIGFYNLNAIGKDSLYIWGTTKSEKWKIYFFDGNQLSEILSIDESINALATFNAGTMIISINNKAYVISGSNDPYLLFEMQSIIESIAIAGNGEIFFSVPEGIFKINKNKEIELITDKYHGLLQVYENKLFILWQEKNQIIMLEEKEETELSASIVTTPFYPSETGNNNLLFSNIDDLNNKIIAENNLVVQQVNKTLEQNKTLAQNTTSVELNNTIINTNPVSTPKSTTKITKPVQQKTKDTTIPKKKTQAKTKTSRGKQTYFAYSGSTKAPFGFQIGRTNNKHGYYVGLRLSFKNSTNESYDCNNTNVLDYNESGYYIFDDKIQNQRFSFTVGYIRQMSSKINMYTGIGYGYSNLLWHIDQYQYPNNIYSDSWIKNTNYSTKGFESEIGIITRISNIINLNTGFSFLNFKKMNWTFGLGFNL